MKQILIACCLLITSALYGQLPRVGVSTYTFKEVGGELKYQFGRNPYKYASPVGPLGSGIIGPTTDQLAPGHIVLWRNTSDNSLTWYANVDGVIRAISGGGSGSGGGFSGSYLDLSNRPAGVSAFPNDANYTTLSGSQISFDNRYVRLSGTYFNPDWLGSIDWSKITQSASARFITDVERTTWNGKQNALGFTPYNATNPLGFQSASDVNNAIAGKQNNLISGTNIRSVNGQSLMGSGDILITAGGSYSAGSGITIANNTISAVPTVLYTDDDGASGGTLIGSGVSGNPVRVNPAIMATKASPSLTGVPTAPTAATGTNTTQIATTGFVQQAISGVTSSTASPYTRTVQAFRNSGSNIKYESDVLSAPAAKDAIGLGGLHTMQVVTITSSTTLGGVGLYIRTPGTYTAVNTNAVSLYSYNSSTQSYSLVASSGDLPNVWKSAIGHQQVPFTATVVIPAGTYYIDLLYSKSSETTQPSLLGYNGANPGGDAILKLPGMTNYLIQNIFGGSVPNTFAQSDIAGGSLSRLWLYVY